MDTWTWGGDGEWVDGDRVSVWGDGKFWRQRRVTLVQPCECTQRCWDAYLNCIDKTVKHSLCFTYLPTVKKELGFQGGACGKEPACQCRRHKRCGFHPWVGKISWRRAWQPTSVFLPRKSHGQRSLESWSVGSQWVRHNLATENALTLWKDLHSQPK